jgi:hypothetical protein
VPVDEEGFWDFASRRLFPAPAALFKADA